MLLAACRCSHVINIMAWEFSQDLSLSVIFLLDLAIMDIEAVKIILDEPL